MSADPLLACQGGNPAHIRRLPPMESPTVSKKQPVIVRLMFFVIGGGMSSLLNTGIFRVSHKVLGWPDTAAYGLSVSQNVLPRVTPARKSNA